MKIHKYLPGNFESKWQEKWKQAKLHEANLKDSKEHYYVLVEFSYPSGDLHMGHWYAFAVPDILARFKRMTGYKVFFPNGFDAFGLPAENAAIKRNIHPKDWTISNIEKMKSQFATMGASFDWSHEVITCLPEYYKWNQWIFLKMLEKGLAYKGQKASNWCPSCQTVLANENVEDGKCWRCGTIVEQKQVSQWFLKITEFADRLEWKENPTVDWPKPVREGQNNWIGRSEGVNFRYKVKDLDIYFEMYDSVPQTFMAQTFTVIAPEHPQIIDLVKGTKYEADVMKFVDKIKQKKAANKFEIDREVDGIFTGRYIEYTPTGKLIPVWLASFVIADYGSGVVNASAHDERDFAFAKKYGIDLHPVMFPKDPKEAEKVKNLEYCYHHASDGVLQEPVQFKGRKWGEVRLDIIDFIEKKGYGKRKSQYHLHDWSISRQRYWGTPIPIIYCSNCAQEAGSKKQEARDISIIEGREYEIIPVPEKDLPVELPYEVDYAPKGKPPLATAEDWVNVKCPKCGKDAKREVETMDTFIDSSWYFFRYLDPKNNDQPFSKDKIGSWLPVDVYFGGAEHTLGHTLYSRFFTKFLFDIGLSPVEEYANKRVNRGLILGPDGAKMSKSKGNVINPDDQVKDFGADAVRLYLAFIGPYAETVTPWENSGVAGVFHFLQRVWALQGKISDSVDQYISKSAKESSRYPESLTTDDLRIMHKTIKKVTDDLNQEKFNTAVAFLMEWLNHLSRKEKISVEEYKTLLLLLAPFAPHMSEELYQTVILKAKPEGSKDLKSIRPSFGGRDSSPSARNDKNWSIHQQSFPKYEEKYLEEDEILIVVQVNGKLRDSLMIQKDMVDNSKDIENLAKSTKNTQKYLENTAVKKVIYIPGKLINFVV